MTREEAIHFAECLKNNWTINFADMEEFCNMVIEALYKPTSDDLIIKGAKGIQDGLYNIQNGELFQYKAKGGTVRTYPIVEALQDDWIPVSDDTLPKDARPVLVYAWNVHHVVGQYKNMRTDDGEYEDMWVTASAYEAPHRIENVIAWKPLTIPCKGESEEV